MESRLVYSEAGVSSVLPAFPACFFGCFGCSGWPACFFGCFGCSVRGRLCPSLTSSCPLCPSCASGLVTNGKRLLVLKVSVYTTNFEVIWSLCPRHQLHDILPKFGVVADECTILPNLEQGSGEEAVLVSIR